jgi:hypothetical protein
VDRLIARGERNVVVMGDLNEGPAVLGQRPANLAPLFDPNGPLLEVYSLEAFDPVFARARSRDVGSVTYSTTSSSHATSPP